MIASVGFGDNGRLTELLFIRHGETAFNVEGRLQGHQDSGLTELGMEQARALAGRLSRMGIERLYSSDLGRARITAEIIGAACGLAPIAEARFRERAYGLLEGLTWAEAQERHPGVREAYVHDPNYAIPGGESLRELLARVGESVEITAVENEGKRVAVVTHGGFISCLFRYVVGLPLEAPRRVRLPNGSINAIEEVDGGWMIRSWGDTGHLE